MTLQKQLKETLDSNPESVDLLAELIKVSGRMAYNYEANIRDNSGYKSVPCLYHKLCKDIIICPTQLKSTKEKWESFENPKLQEFFKWEG
jgi:hypothetical protein